jgi:hypothetical protein
VLVTPDTPVDLQAPADGLLLNVVFFTLGAAGLAYAIFRSARDRDPVPMLLVVGAVVAVLAEATFDLLGNIWYPANIRPRAFTMLDRPIPLFLLAGYIPWVGVLPLLLKDWIGRGVASRTLYALAAAIGLSNVIVDAVGTSANTWSYYSTGPLHYVTTAPVIAALPLLMAWTLLAGEDILRGPKRLGIVFIPPFALSALFAGVGWPVYAALHIDGLPAALELGAGLTMLVILAGVVHFLVKLLAPYGPAVRRGPATTSA